jgi:hypothetical protein
MGPAALRQWLLGGVQGGRPERDPTVQVVDVDDDLQEAAAVVALRYQHVMADRQGAIAAALDGLARDANKKSRRRPRARRGHDEQQPGEREEGGRRLTCALGGSGRRESNPHRELGKLEFYH